VVGRLDPLIDEALTKSWPLKRACRARHRQSCAPRSWNSKSSEGSRGGTLVSLI
jgi:hypothetical protein